MRDAAVAINPDVIVLCHGGPIAEPDDAQYVLERTRGGRLLRRVEHGAAADRGRHDREHAAVQGGPRRLLDGRRAAGRSVLIDYRRCCRWCRASRGPDGDAVGIDRDHGRRRASTALPRSARTGGGHVRPRRPHPQRARRPGQGATAGGDPRRVLPTRLAHRRDGGRQGARHQPGAGARGPARARGARASSRSSRSAARACAAWTPPSCSRPTSSVRRSRCSVPGWPWPG